MRINVRKLKLSWQYDFNLPGHARERRAGYRTKAAALAAGEERLDDILHGKKKVTFSQLYEQYMAATALENRTRESYEHLWKRIGPELGHLFIEDVDTSAMDAFKLTLPKAHGPKTINQHLILISAVLNFALVRGKLKVVPHIPRVKVPKKARDWYTEAERDQLLKGMFDLQPQWYAFFYVSARLGLRLGEVYALTHQQVRDIPPQFIIDRAAERGTKKRDVRVKARKNDEVLILGIPEDVMQAVRWHVAQGYAGDTFLFCKDDQLPRYIDSHKGPLKRVQRALGLRELSHHSVGRHSVGGQAMTSGAST